jgi:acyl-CoA thioesterase FadM
VEEVNYSMPVRNTKVEFKSLSVADKVLYVSLRVMEWIYKTLYFHFWPYIGLFYSFYGVNQT